MPRAEEASAALPKLRDSVVVSSSERGVQIRDGLTGLTFGLPLELDPRRSADADLWSDLESLGLVQGEPLSIGEIRERQRELRLEMLAEHRLARLRATLASGCENVPYYRARKAVYAPGAIRSYDDFAKLPMISKAGLREAYPAEIVTDRGDVKSKMEAGQVVIATSSGTTGERVQVVSDLTLGSVPQDFQVAWGLTDLGGIARTAVLASPTCMGTECHLGNMPFDERIRMESTLFLNSSPDIFSVRRGLVEEIIADLNRFKPALLMANPVYLHVVLRRAEQWGLEFPSVRGVMASYQYLTHAGRRYLSERLKAPIIDFYTASDLGGSRVGVGCPHGRVHVREDHVYLETTPLPDGPKDDVGNLVVTTNNWLMPLVRYQIGDLGRFTNERCSCTWPDWPTFELHGRRKDMLWLGGRWVTTRQFDDVLSTVEGIDLFRADQPAEGKLEVKVIAAPGKTPDLALLASRLVEHFGPQDIRSQLVTRLEPEASLKYRHTACHWRATPEGP